MLPMRELRVRSGKIAWVHTNEFILFFSYATCYTQMRVLFHSELMILKCFRATWISKYQK